jgi:hypothetical protein
MFVPAEGCVAVHGRGDPMALAASSDVKPRVAAAPALANTRRVMRCLIIVLL